MYTLKVSYGYVDEPKMATVETLGTYETWDRASGAARDKFLAIMDDLRGDTDTCYGEIDGSQYDYYVTDGDHDVEFGRVFSGHDYYCQVSVIER